MIIRNNKQLIKFILSKAKKLCKSLNNNSSFPKRGRPPLYKDYLIIFALLLKVLENLSLRDLERRLRDFFPNPPDHTTLWYRFRKIQNSYIKELIHQTAKEIMKELRAKEFYCLIPDG